jgi:hypothetical protein
MNRSYRAILLLTQALLLSVTGCALAPESAESTEKVQDTAQLSEALTDSFSTPAQAELTTALANDRVFNVWLANTTVGGQQIAQVVGQMFNLSGVPLGPSRVYTNSAHSKFQPSVSYNGAGKFLIAFCDAYSSSDDDILGLVVDINGALLSSTNIDFSSNLEQMPQVTYVPTGINKWLVTYERNGSPNDTVFASFVDTTGAVTSTGTIFSSPDIPLNPQAQYSIPTGRLMFVWNMGGSTEMDVRFSSTTFALGPISSITPAGLHMYEYQSLAFQPNAESMGLAYFEEEPFADTGKRVHLRIFPRACESFSCALPEQATGITTSASITSLYGPRLTTLGTSYIIHNGLIGPGLPNQNSIRFTVLNQSGVLTSSNNAVTPACPTALNQNNLGYSRFVAVATNSSASRINVMYDAFCPNFGKIRGQQDDTSFAHLTYAVSD